MIYRARGGVVRLEWHGHLQDTMATAGRVALLLRLKRACASRG